MYFVHCIVMYFVHYIMMYFVHYIVIYFVHCIVIYFVHYIVMYFVYCDAFYVLWCILCIVMYFIYCDVLYILRCILCIAICMNSRCIRPIVSGRMCGWLICDSSTTLHFTAFPHVGSVQRARRPAQQSRFNACILMMLYTYYHGCDARLRDVCTLVPCHIWLCRVWYVCHICHMLLSTVCHASRFLQSDTPTRLLQVVLS